MSHLLLGHDSSNFHPYPSFVVSSRLTIRVTFIFVNFQILNMSQKERLLFYLYFIV